MLIARAPPPQPQPQRRTSFYSTIAPKFTAITRHHFDSLQRAYSRRDLWNLLDATMRFHRFAYQAFHNLHMHAKVKGKVKRFMAQRRNLILVNCWRSWQEIVAVGRRLNQAGRASGSLLNGVDDDPDAYLESADVLVYRIRTHHSSKLIRARKIMQEVTLHTSQIEFDEEDAHRKHIQRMKNLNLIDADDDEYLKRQRREALIRIHENKQRLAQKWLHDYQPPNMFELDEQDRARELKLMRDMLMFGRRLKEETIEEVRDAEERTKKFEEYNATIGGMVQVCACDFRPVYVDICLVDCMASRIRVYVYYVHM